MRRPFLVPSLILTLGSLALLHCSSSDNSSLSQDTAGTGGTGGSKAGASGKGGSAAGKGGSDTAGSGGDDGGSGAGGGDVEPTTEEGDDESCSDEQDNDGDGHIDCDDFDCAKNGNVTVCGTGPSGGAEVCDDGKDNDGNNFVDCADYACCKGADAKTNCPDGCEQKGGGSTGKGGSGGSGSGGTEICGNNKDDNGNGFADCEDFACCKGDAAATACPGGCIDKGGTGSGTEICGNGKDDNGNGFADCEDYSCCKAANPNAKTDCPNGCIGGGSTGKGGSGGSGSTKPEEDNCTDGIDNDGNKFVDCKDFACCNPDRNPTAEKDCGKAALCPKTGGSGGSTAATGPREDTEALCGDKLDNDGNGKADCDDFACSGFTVCSNETTDEACKDGTDNDGDGKTDCDDFSCLFAAGVTVCDLTAKEATDATCKDGVDNNGNKAIDCKDFACKSNPKVSVCK